MKLHRYLILLIVFSASFVLAQFEDDMLGDEQAEQTEESCIPSNMKTGWDSLASKKPDQDIRLLYNFGYEYYKNKAYKDAMPYLWKVFLHGPDRYARSSIRKIAEIYFTQGQVDSTLIACYRGLERFPTLVRLHHYAGLLENKLGKFRCAIPHFEALVKKDSTSVTYLKTLAFLYFKNKDDRAIEVQEKVVKLSPQNAEEANTLAVYVKEIRGEGADLEFRKKAWEQDPGNMDFAYSYAQAAVQAGNYKEALKPLGDVIAKKPSVQVYLTRAEAYENLNQINNAIKDYKSVLKKEPKNISVMLRIVENYRNINAFAKARTWVYKALKAKPGYGQAYISMGEIYEAAVSYCQGHRKGKNKTKYEDKLVYQLAANEYVRAAKDPSFRSKAKKKLENVKPFTPTKEDKFMHKGAKIKSKCYGWIK